jgi:hypothetical protein
LKTLVFLKKSKESQVRHGGHRKKSPKTSVKTTYDSSTKKEPELA